MGKRWRSQHVRLKYTFMKAHRQEFDTALMWCVLDVSRSGFYTWLRNPLSNRAGEDQRWSGLIVAAYTASHGVYGATRIFLDLREAGETCSKQMCPQNPGMSALTLFPPILLLNLMLNLPMAP